MNRTMILAGVGSAWLGLMAVGQGRGEDADPPPRPAAFECRWTHSPIKLDGQADEPAWQGARVIESFYQPWMKEEPRAAKTPTKARLLWDRENFYFFAEMEDSDLYADITQHDGQTWDNDVFELFFKPADDKPGYYEFQVNAAGTTKDMFLPRRGAGGFTRFIKDGDFQFETKVATRGTLNKWQDKDSGWSVEGRLAWRDFVRTGGRPAVEESWKFALCRYDYSVDFEGPALSTCAPLASRSYPDFHRHEDYATLKFVGPQRVGADAKTSDVLVALKKNFASVPSRVAGSPEPPLPYRVERVWPNFKPTFPIFAAVQPGTRRLLFIDQKYAYGPARLARTMDDPATGESETLFEFPSGGVGYSIAFHPKFADNGFVYIGWNGPQGTDGKHSIVTRYTIDREPPYRFDVASAKDIIRWASDGHNGAAIAFGLDGMMYVTTGDGTSDSDTNVVGQGLDHLLAKVLRIDVDRPDGERAYSIPADNPFVNMPGARGETWAYGLRNPWRMTVDPKTGDVWVGNNGQDLWEQVYRVRRGDNFGWSVYEGSHPFYLTRKLGPTPHTPPTFEHSHSESRSLTGGIVYHGRKLPELAGAYLYADHSTGKIWAGKLDADRVAWHRELADTTLSITAISLDAAGELLIADHRGGGDGGFYTLVPNNLDAKGTPAPFPRKLSDSGLFASVPDHRLHPGAIPYSVNAPLWSDGAHKERFLVLPPSDKPTIDLSANRGWDLPDLTVAVKSFAIETEEGNLASRRWIETRFLTKQAGEWVGYSYEWNEEQTDATLVDKDGRDRKLAIRDAAGNVREQTWRFPSRTECMVCHSRAAKFVLGLSTLQMNKVHDYGGQSVNQLEVLEGLGVLKMNNWSSDFNAAVKEELKRAGDSEADINRKLADLTATRDQRTSPPTTLLFQRPEAMPRLVDPYDASQSLADRARSYLHANCSICHVEAGGGNAAMELEFNIALDKMRLIDVVPLHNRFNLPDARLIAPGAPDRSVLLHRISRRGEGQMPQLATVRVDEAAVELFREWIREMK